MKAEEQRKELKRLAVEAGMISPNYEASGRGEEIGQGKGEVWSSAGG